MFATKLSKTTRLKAFTLCLCAWIASSGHAQIPTNPLAATPTQNTPTAAPMVTPVQKSPAPVPLLLPTVQSAVPAAPAQNSATALEIQKINENMTLLQTQLNQLELQVKVAEKKRSLNGLTATSSGYSSFDPNKGNPSVISVAGIKGQLEAVLVFPGGVTQRVKEGNVIDDRIVTKITVNEVVLSNIKDKSQQRLPFGTTAIIRETPLNTQQALPGMPTR